MGTMDPRPIVHARHEFLAWKRSHRVLSTTLSTPIEERFGLKCYGTSEDEGAVTMSGIGCSSVDRTACDFEPGGIRGRENVLHFRGDPAASCNPSLWDRGPARQVERANAISAEWGQRVGGYAHLPMLIREFGLNAGSMLESSSLPADAFDDEDAWIPYAALGKLLLECAHRTGCAHFGLLAGRMSCLSDLGAVGELVRNSACVGDALNGLSQHQHLDSEGGATYLINVGDTVELGYVVYHPNVVGSHQLVNRALAANFNYVRELCGCEWVPSAVLIPMAKPLDIAPYRGIFKVTPRFDSEVGALRFPDRWMRKPVAGAAACRLQDARKRVQHARGANLIARVYSALRLMLLIERHGGDDVAQRLALNRRTLNRRLRQHGTTFQEALDNVRFTVARELLSMHAIRMDDVAAALGYAGVCPFLRTFQRWAGTTPGRWRRAVALGGSLTTSQTHFNDEPACPVRRTPKVECRL